MMKEYKSVIKEVLEIIKPPENEDLFLEDVTKNFCITFGNLLNKKRIKANVFVGGSIAKKTIIRKDKYDIDLFVRFDYQKYSKVEGELGDILDKMVKEGFNAAKKMWKGKNFCMQKIHGSRDYFNISFYSEEIKRNIIIEIVPTLQIKKASEAKNITDLSFMHVKYVLDSLKKNDARNDILLAKAFCYAQGVYGAESHIKGFSGYAIELLVLHYKNFYNLIKNACSWKERIIIDTENLYGGEEEILENMNEAKLMSPIVLIDPTQKSRNACAALSSQTLKVFVEACRNFLKKPDSSFFEEKKLDIKKIEMEAKKKKAKMAAIRITTASEREEISASRIIKFSNFITYMLKKWGFGVISREIDFIGPKNKSYEGILYVTYKEPSKIKIIEGPPVSLKQHADNFKKQYKKTFLKNKKIFAKTKREITSVNKMVSYIKKSQEIRDMKINSISI
jgi:tRNA nucleotidyltransferase (CCA-adding enzyme)